MKNIILIFILFFLYSCNKPKTVLICGDHVCVNKAEAKKYFEENLSLEVKVVDKKENKDINLVELNLRSNSDGEKIILVSDKNKTSKKLKVLSKKEIQNKKNEINLAKKNNSKIFRSTKKIKNKVWSSSQIVNKTNDKIVDICTIIEKCNIQEISKYLIKRGKKRGFPDITIRE